MGLHCALPDPDERRRTPTGLPTPVDHGYRGSQPAEAAAQEGIQLEVVKLPTTKRGFILLPRRWVVERSVAWMARFGRLARDDERLPETLAGLHPLAFALILLKRFIVLLDERA